jgi:hypothetical protein
MSAYELAQINVAVLKAPIDSPQLADFVSSLDRVNTIAEHSPGFIWRLKAVDGNATSFRPMGDDTIINVSMWRDVAALNDFVYRNPAHVDVMKRRREWFEHVKEAYTALWWLPRGQRPGETECVERLMLLRAMGPTPKAFSFKQAFAAPDAPTPGKAFAFGDVCPA